MDAETIVGDQTMIDNYLSHLPNSGMRDNSIKEVRLSMGKFSRWLGSKAISRRTLSEFRDFVGQHDWAATYKNLVLAHVKAMLRWGAMRDELGLNEDAISRCLKPFRVDKNAPVVLTREHLDGLAAGCLQYPRTGRTVLAVLATGARHHEILGMERQDITPHGIEIGADRSKNHQGRVIPWTVLGPRVQKLFDPMPFEWDRHDWDAIRAVARRPNMKVKNLRSTAATYWISRGLLPPRTCAALMGHTVAVAERAYWGSPVLGLDGEFVDEWLGLQDAVNNLTA